jgi:hypothetical protein
MSDEWIVTCKSCNAEFGFDLYFENNGFCPSCWVATFTCEDCQRECDRKDAHTFAWTCCNACVDRRLETPLFDQAALTEPFDQSLLAKPFDQVRMPSAGTEAWTPREGPRNAPSEVAPATPRKPRRGRRRFPRPK